MAAAAILKSVKLR